MLTVAIPTLGRPDYALDALRSIAVQECDDAFEVLVLDNANDKRFASRVRDTAAGVQVPVTYVPVPSVGLHNARHEAARRARGDVVAYVDDDVLAEPGWMATLQRVFRDPEVHVAGGPCLPWYEAETPPWLDSFVTRNHDCEWWCGLLTLVDLGPEERDVDPLRIWGANFAIRRSTLVRVGGFHPDGLPWSLRRFRGDGESAVSTAVSRLGLRAAYSPHAAVKHRVPGERLTVRYLERRAYLQGISDSFSAARSPGTPSEDAGLPVLGRAAHGARVGSWLRQCVMPRTNARRQQNELALVAAAYQAGFAYHCEQLSSDDAVRTWVGRSDYWDAVVPGDDEAARAKGGALEARLGA